MVTGERHCPAQLQNPSNPSVLLYDANGNVLWRDGTSSFPICLPSMEQNTDPVAYLIGMTDEGCLVKVPVTYEGITTCEGPVVTVPALSVV